MMPHVTIVQVRQHITSDSNVMLHVAHIFMLIYIAYTIYIDTYLIRSIEVVVQCRWYMHANACSIDLI